MKSKSTDITVTGSSKIKRIDPYAKLPRAERKRIARLVKYAKLRGMIPRSAQHTIAYDELCRSGLLRRENSYNRMVEFGDINYRLAANEEKERIFGSWSKLLNSFDPSLTIQLSFVNQRIDLEQLEEQIALPALEDGLDELREEYTQLLRGKLQKGNNGLTKRKFITFGLCSDSREAAERKLERVETELLNSLRQLEVNAQRRNGYQRMELLHDLYNIGTEKKLNFNWSLIAQTGLTTKDFIAPNSFDFRERSSFDLGCRLGRVSYLQISANELPDELLSELLDTDCEQVITLHIQPVDRSKALKQIKGLLSDVQKMTIEEQMKAARQGYDMDILPPDLVDSKEEATDLLENLQNRDERMFLVTFLLLHFAENEEELTNRCFVANQICQKHNCELLPLDWQQEAGLMASSPIGVNPVQLNRMLTTSNTAIFIPFQTQELFMPGGICYGCNAISGNIIIIDRKQAQNCGGVFLGKSGSGKSFAVKCELFMAFFLHSDDILINDPEREYTALVQALGGQVIRIAADSSQHINPMDINQNAQNEEDKDY
ncbi:MAG: conjugal transfer protein TraE, partial [Angelakisella sp.]